MSTSAMLDRRPELPALLKRQSSRPKVASACSIIALTSLSTATSVLTKLAARPSRRATAGSPVGLTIGAAHGARQRPPAGRKVVGQFALPGSARRRWRADKLWETSHVIESAVGGGKMTPRDLLGVFVRLAGLGLILFALFDLYYVVVKTLGIPTMSTVPLGIDVRGAIVYSISGLF